MKETEQRIIKNIGDSKVSNIKTKKNRVYFDVNNWSYEVREPTEDFIEHIQKLAGTRRKPLER